MTEGKKEEKNEDFEKNLFGGLIGKLAPWLRAFLNESDNRTFLNKTESAKVAGYKGNSENSFASIGCQNYRKLNKRISYWLDKNGLSDNTLELKLVSLMNVHETKIINVKGELEKDDKGNYKLPPNCNVIATTKEDKISASGDKYTEYHNVIGINMDSNNVQAKSLEMALKVKGKFTDKVEITNLSDLGKRLNEAHKRD